MVKFCEKLNWRSSPSQAMGNVKGHANKKCQFYSKIKSKYFYKT